MTILRTSAQALRVLSLASAPFASLSNANSMPLQSDEARALFIANCATCHGEAGDGKGVTQLDRQARSFKDGGFSFGDTTEAITRVLKSGIPGTPMPSFAGTMSDEQLAGLAEYVVSLGPERREVTASETILRVTNKPLIARGMLPPISAAATEQTRGLLIGTTEGLSFEWRTDDVRLLGVRQGDFVDRRDWVGRGGSHLQPLGKVVYLCGDGKPGAPFAMLVGPKGGVPQLGSSGREQVALRAQLMGSWVRGLDAGLRYRLETADGTSIATIEDSARALGTSVGSGFRRTITMTGGERDETIVMNAASTSAKLIETFTSVPVGDPSRPLIWQISQYDDGLFQCAATHFTGLTAAKNNSHVLRGGGGANLWLHAAPGRSGTVQVSVVITTEWSPKVRTALELEVAQ
ncbi:MAG: mono/diheme cytochrome c family protein [Planctomycetota bacterium]|jgi:mono/diheme cytochrome c family protein